jgi:hypothetical protein
MFVAQTFAILGIGGSGKKQKTAVILVEGQSNSGRDVFMPVAVPWRLCNSVVACSRVYLQLCNTAV